MEEVEVRLCPDAAALLDSSALPGARCLVLKDHPPWVLEKPVMDSRLIASGRLK